MKRLIICILTVAMILLEVSTISAAQSNAVVPQYENAASASVDINISDSGKATIGIFLNGKTGVKKVSVTTYLEKKVSGKWHRVDISASNDEWVYTTTSRLLSKTYTTNLNSKGEYRAVAVFTITASTVEVITCTDTRTY